MRIVALAGGVGAGRFLRGLIRTVDPAGLTVVVNTGDDLSLHGLDVSPDLDSVCYWLAGLADRERGWGRADESFRSLEALEELGAEAWFALGDRDLATHLVRTGLLRAGKTLTEATAAIRLGMGIRAEVLPMSDDPVTTRIEVLGPGGERLDLHFQEYWVRRRARDPVKGIRYQGVGAARPAPGVLEALGAADGIVICPSNPVASILPIMAVPGVRPALRARRGRVVAITPIVGGAPLGGMADRLMPAAGLEVSGLGTARAYRDEAGAFVLDQRDQGEAEGIRSLDMTVAVTDTVMVDDGAAARLAAVALGLVA